ncbi:MAG: oligosaccharide flippase family protein, partial [Defluviitaleaceae bacterium]|nr:oligosaccharide flippase family protein [Defluviitaleaceae bacterium]
MGGFVKQAAILASAGIVVRLIGFAYRLPLTALIGDEGNGIYGASYNMYLFFLVVSSAGFPAAISKMVSERTARGAHYNAHEVFRTCLLLVGGLGFAASATLALGAGFFAWIINPYDPVTYHAILALAPTVFLVAIMAVFRGYFQGLATTGPTAVSQLVEQVFNAVFTVVLAMMFLNITGDIAMGAAGATAGKGVGAFFG